jgi:hypothetical protein
LPDRPTITYTRNWNLSCSTQPCHPQAVICSLLSCSKIGSGSASLIKRCK